MGRLHDFGSLQHCTTTKTTTRPLLQPLSQNKHQHNTLENLQLRYQCHHSQVLTLRKNRLTTSPDCTVLQPWQEEREDVLKGPSKLIKFHWVPSAPLGHRHSQEDRSLQEDKDRGVTMRLLDPPPTQGMRAQRRRSCWRRARMLAKVLQVPLVCLTITL
jgi:hypothetical protein